MDALFAVMVGKVALLFEKKEQKTFGGLLPLACGAGHGRTCWWLGLMKRQGAKRAQARMNLLAAGDGRS